MGTIIETSEISVRPGNFPQDNPPPVIRLDLVDWTRSPKRPDYFRQGEGPDFEVIYTIGDHARVMHKSHHITSASAFYKSVLETLSQGNYTMNPKTGTISIKH